ncbi:MAG: selenide, water dikinase SelD [Coriobacteriia bacterium]|nr:selenide, water dikinase SelD [Coriobacteriia bacterium]
MQGSPDALAALQDDDLLLGFETSDDAAVFRINDETAVLLTVDFFTPIVDDPYDFGRIAAANALSDIYAMGGRPVTAMNLLAFSCALGAEVVGEVLRGGAEKVAEAGAVIVGGHTIDDAEPKYGLSVMGTVHPDRVLYNRGARCGDTLVLTKALGTGIWGTALKRELHNDQYPPARAAIEAMAQLNKEAAEAIDAEAVHACTDITGFGLVGHLHEMMAASGTVATVELDKLPLLDGVWELAAAGIRPGKTSELTSWARDFTNFDTPLPPDQMDCWYSVVCDPQTSGGLLLAMDQAAADAYVGRYPQAHQVGTVAAATGDSVAGSLRFV